DLDRRHGCRSGRGEGELPERIQAIRGIAAAVPPGVEPIDARLVPPGCARVTDAGLEPADLEDIVRVKPGEAGRRPVDEDSLVQGRLDRPEQVHDPEAQPREDEGTVES